jgi:hypothetical protein
MSESISRELLGKIVDEVFDGAIEDASVIEDIYAVINRHEAPPPTHNVVPAGTVVGLIDWNGTKASVIDAVLEARSAVYTQPAELSVGGEPVAEIVTATTPAAEILFGRDIKFLVDQRDIPIGTKLYAAPAELSVGETFTREQMLAEVERRVERALAAREALAPAELSVGVEEAVSAAIEPIIRQYPIGNWRDHQVKEAVRNAVVAGRAEIERLESLHRTEIADMAERFRSVNVSEAMKQLADILPAASAEHVLALEKAAEALSPLADAVFNDNGDMTVSVPLLSAEDCIQAYFAVKRILAALSASEVQG